MFTWRLEIFFCVFWKQTSTSYILPQVMAFLQAFVESIDNMTDRFAYTLIVCLSSRICSMQLVL